MRRSAIETRVDATSTQPSAASSHPPGQPNDTHYHLHDEWWVVLAGEIDWYIEDEPKPIRGRAGDFVFGPKNRWHHLEPVGTEPSIRIAINARGEFHRYDRPGCKPLPARCELPGGCSGPSGG